MKLPPIEGVKNGVGVWILKDARGSRYGISRWTLLPLGGAHPRHGAGVCGRFGGERRATVADVLGVRLWHWRLSAWRLWSSDERLRPTRGDAVTGPAASDGALQLIARLSDTEDAGGQRLVGRSEVRS
jgi:hypothetical protein